MRIYLFILIFCFLSIDAQVVTIPPKASDSSSVNTSNKKPDFDSLVIPSNIVRADSLSKDSLKSKAPLFDSTEFKGFFAGIGIGWELGNLEIVKKWEKSLPDSLGKLNLLPTSFQMQPDTSSQDSLTRRGDTAHIYYVIKDKPSTYNMSFPISLSLTSFSKNHKFTTSISFSLLSKSQKGSVYLLDDSLNRRIDLRQKFLFYSLSLNCIYQKRIPSFYFNVDGVDRLDVLFGVGLTPLMKFKTTSTLKSHSDDLRITTIEDTIRTQLKDKSSYGFSASLRTGISTTKHLSKGAVEFDIFYSFSWYNYFLDNGTRIKNNVFESQSENSDKPLSFISNRIDISISFLHNLSKNEVK